MDTITILSVLLWLTCPSGEKVMVQGELHVPKQDIVRCGEQFIYSTYGIVGAVGDTIYPTQK